MVEREEQVVEPDGTMPPRPSESNGQAFFRASELCEHMVPLRAGIGGYHHPRAPSNNRSQLVKEMARDAEREGWIRREQGRYGGIYKYALTESGRHVYREKIAPQRDAFVKNYLKAKEAMLRQTSSPTPEVPKPLGQGDGDTDKVDRIRRLQKRYERGDPGSE